MKYAMISRTSDINCVFRALFLPMMWRDNGLRYEELLIS
jgi:hypothetical protein